MSARVVAISGTGTNVGKTHVACAITALLAETGPACGVKPYESGHPGPLGADQAALAAVSTHTASDLGFPLQCFPVPVAPPAAARAAGVAIDLDGFVHRFQRLRATYTGTLVLELAGGLFSPFDDVSSNADVLRGIAPEAHVLVAPNRLGVIHDVRATLLAARGGGLRFTAIVLSHPPGAGEDPSCASNPSAIAPFAVAPLVLVPRGTVAEATATLRSAPAFEALRRR
jgi:dethiobiotin synthetase